MLVIFCVTLILLCVFMSSGYALFSLLRYEPRNPFLSLFMGMFVVSVLGMTVSLFIPLGVGASLLCFVPALFGIKNLKKRINEQCTSWGGDVWAWALVGLCVLTALYAFTFAWARWPAIAYDTDLYHIQIVRWLNEYGTPLGIGNVHSRLANSSAWLVVAALLNHGVLKGSVAWCMMPFFLTGFAAYFLYELVCGKAHYARAYAVCMLPVCVYANINLGYPNLYHDFPSLALACIIGSELLYFLYDKDCPAQKHATTICICVALAFLLKPLPVVTVLCVPLLLLYLLHTRHLLTWGTVVMLFGLPVCAAFVWCARNVIVSGYPFFPMPFFSFDVDWRMAPQEVIGNALDVRAWARMPGPEYMEAFRKGISFWFVPWLSDLLRSKISIMLILPPLCLGTLCWFFARKHLIHFIEVFLLIWPLLSIVYWFWLAPAPRFGIEYFWLFFALGAAVCIRYRPKTWQSLYGRIGRSERCMCTYYIVCIATLILAGGLLRHVKFHQPHEIAWGKPSVIEARSTEVRAIQHRGRASFDVYVVSNGDDRCGDAPLPCTPHFSSKLEMRKDGDMSAGFRKHP